jgi:hypothetical protein
MLGSLRTRQLNGGSPDPLGRALLIMMQLSQAVVATDICINQAQVSSVITMHSLFHSPCHLSSKH